MKLIKREELKERIMDDHAKNRWDNLLFLAPSLIGVAVFFVLPFGVVIYFSFLDNSISKNLIGFDNYLKLADNMAFHLATKNTSVFCFTAVPLAVVLGMILALILYVDLPGSSFLRSSLLTPLMVPTASVVLIFTILFNYNGVINNMAVAAGKEPIDWLKSGYGMLVIILLFVWKNTGYNMVLFLAALGSVPGELVEAAKLDGAGRLKIFFEIKLRYLAPMIVFTSLFSILNSFKVFREIYLLTGDYPFESLYTLQHYMNNTFTAADYGKLSTAAIYMCLVVIVVTLLLFAAEKKLASDIEEA